MTSILYYSNFCEHSKKLLQSISKTQLGKDIHFMCIDKRVSEGGKIYIVLETGQKVYSSASANNTVQLVMSVLESAND